MKNSPITIANSIWKNFAGNASIEELQFDLEVHKKILNFFQVGDYYYYILTFLPTGVNFAFISKEAETLLGYPLGNYTIEFYVGIVHPEDQPYVINNENAIGHFLNSLPIEKRTKYKIRYDCRVRKANGEYIRVLHQSTMLKHDGAGNPLMTLCVETDITHLKKEGKPVLSYIGLEGEPSFIDVDVEKVLEPSQELLTPREQEILTMIIEGRTIKEIAALLDIAEPTVNKHRENMLKKAGVKNAPELVGKAIRMGWI